MNARSARILVTVAAFLCGLVLCFGIIVLVSGRISAPVAQHVAAIGGPSGLTAFVRGLGDQFTRLDRDEPSLNEALPDDPRDTTTQNAMASTLQALILGTKALSPPSRELLTAWLVANKTGDTRLRAGFAKDWRIGDKTGTGARGTNNDVGVAWPPNRPPIVVTVYLTGATVSAAEQNATVASVARAVSAMLAG